jgi:hypothetical protein
MRENTKDLYSIYSLIYFSYVEKGFGNFSLYWAHLPSEIFYSIVSNLISISFNNFGWLREVNSSDYDENKYIKYIKVNSNQMVVTSHEAPRLSADDIRRMVEDAEKYREGDSINDKSTNWNIERDERINIEGVNYQYQLSVEDVD